MGKPFYISQLPEKTQSWIKEKTKENFLKDGMSEEEAEQKATDFLDEKVNVAEEFFGKDFYKSLDAIKDNFTPPGAKDDIKELKEKHKEKGTANKDDKDLLGLANKLLGGNSQMLLKYNDLPYFDVLKDEDKATYRVYTDGSDKFEKIKDDVKDSPFKDPNYEVNKALSEIDTNDNGEIEKSEMENFTDSLNDYMSKNKKGRDDIPVTTRR